MPEYKREYPLFSLCGLNCGLCPHFQTEGASKCPGCGGEDFYLKHPSCKVINCSKKHGQFEYCFQCPVYPCEKYQQPYTVDSFITYANVHKDMEKAQKYGIDNYKAELGEKLLFLDYLLTNFNDGRRKSYYCLAINLLDLSVLQSIHRQIAENITGLAISHKEKINLILQLFEAQASALNIEIKLRK